MRPSLAVWGLALAVGLTQLAEQADAASLASKAECQGACVDQIAACKEQCTEFGSTERECRREVLRICRRLGTSACPAAEYTGPCAYTGSLPPTSQSMCGGSCPEGMRCETVRILSGLISCNCAPVPEWRIPCTWEVSEVGPMCKGPCPVGFTCDAQPPINRGYDFGRCLCVPNAFVDAAG